MKTIFAILLLLLSCATTAFSQGFNCVRAGFTNSFSVGITPQWFDTTLTRDGNNAATASFESAYLLTVGNAGTATKLRIKIDTFTSMADIKLALYDSSKNLLGNGSATVTGTGYVEVNITPVAVTATTYYVAHCEQTDNAYTISSFATGGTGLWGSKAYASFPANPYGSANAFSRNDLVGIWVQ